MDEILSEVSDGKIGGWLNEIYSTGKSRYYSNSSSAPEFVNTLIPTDEKLLNREYSIFNVNVDPNVNVDLNVKCPKAQNLFRLKEFDFFGVSLSNELFRYMGRQVPKNFVPSGVPFINNEILVGSISGQKIYNLKVPNIFPGSLKPTKWIPLYNFVCSQFNSSESTIDKLFTDSKSECSETGNKISKSLIKIAATRIFADPRQSFLEIIVNAIDVSTNSKIGKFGMGFFSVLYWLIDHPERTMIINSYYKDESNKYCNFVCEIKEINGELAAQVSINKTMVTITGTQITIDLGNSFEEGNGIKEQMDKILMKDKIDILGSQFGSGFYYDKNLKLAIISNKKPFIMINSNKRFIRVEDFGTGISLETLVNILFVPSISTKTIQISNVPIAERNNSEIIPDQKSFLSFIIGGIVIWTSTALYEHRNYRINIYLPRNSKIPVSRDDIFIMEDSFIESMNLIKLDVIKYNLFVILNKCLREYANFTASTDNKQIVLSYLSKLFDELSANPNYCFVNKEEVLFYNQQSEQKKSNVLFLSGTMVEGTKLTRILYDFFPIYKNKRYIESPSMSDLNIHDQLNVFINKTVVLLNTESSERWFFTASSASFIFVSIDYVNSNRSTWINNLILGSAEEKLLLIDSDFSRKKYKKEYKLYEDIIDEFELKISTDQKEELIKLYIIFQHRFEEIVNTFNVKADKKFVKLSKYSIFYLNLLLLFVKDDNIKDVKFLILHYMNSFRPSGNITYGSKKIIFVPKKDVLYYKNNAKKIRKMFLKYPKTRDYFYKAVEDEISNWNPDVSKILPGDGSVGLYFLEYEKPWFETILDNSFDLYSFDLAISIVLFNRNKTGITPTTDIVIKQLFILISKIKNLSRHNVYTRLDEKEYMFNYRDINMIMEEFVFYLNSSTDQIKTISPTVEKDYSSSAPKEYTFEFSLKKFINVAFKVDFKNKKLSEIVSIVNKSKSIDKFQAVEIAIEAGTTKPFIDAVLTETLQNSLDATREAIFNKTLKDGLISFNVKKDKKNFDLYLSISDKVGMSLENLTSLFIPFLSSKSPSELVTGEMGSGFFNLYRESKQVNIITIKNGIGFDILDTPIKVNGSVVDIKKEIKEFKTKKENSTDITVHIEHKSKSEMIKTYINIQYFFNNTLALITTPYPIGKKVIPIMIEEGKYIGNLIPVVIYQTANATFSYFQNSNKPGYLFTKGVPFANLSEYLPGIGIGNKLPIDEFLIDVSLNIKGNLFVPVQTRTRLNISNKNLFVLKTFILNSLYLYILYKLARGIRLFFIPEAYLENIESETDLAQVIPESKVLDISDFSDTTASRKFMMNWKFFEPRQDSEFENSGSFTTMGELLNWCSKDLLSKEIKKSGYKQAVTATLTLASSTFKLLPDQITVAMGWLLNKSTTSKTGMNNEYTKKPKTEVNILFDRILNAFVKSFVNAMRFLRIQPHDWGKNPKFMDIVVESAELNSNSILGYFDSKTNTITISTNKIFKASILELLKDIGTKDVTRIMANKLWIEVFGNSLSMASTMIHELYHAYLGNEHGDNLHDSNFDRLAIFNYELAIGNGFFDSFLKRMKSSE